MRTCEGEDRIAETALRGIPAVDGIAVMRGEERELRFLVIELEADRRRKSAQQRRHRRSADIAENESLPLRRDGKHARRPACRGLANLAERDIRTVGRDETDR